MKNFLFVISLSFALSIGAKTDVKPISGHYPISPVPFTAVTVNDGFWSPRLEANRKVTIPISYHQSEITGRIEHFVQAAHPGDDVKTTGIFFDDSDVFKIIEGAAYSLQTYPDAALERRTDSIIDLIAAAQEKDGYLYTFRTMNPRFHGNPTVGPERWVNVEKGSHELYNQGHLIEGAVAYFLATGKRKILDVAIKSADCICRAIGSEPNQLKIVPGHEELELALCKLYLVTNDDKYLKQAKFFIDMRGRTATKSEYMQSHLPVTEQKMATGHAVRAAYLYSGIADVAALTGEQQYINTIDTIWKDIVDYRLYLNGGIGSNRNGEAFGQRYQLPNEVAYNETCASIALAFLNQRLFLLHGESKYIDVLERTLYNGLLAGISLEGNTFFYPNPLASHGGYKRSEWFGCACCPSNLCRFIPSLPGYVYAVRNRQLYVNLFLSNKAELQVGGKPVLISQTTEYPWQGDVKITVDKNAAGNFTLAIRIPGWVKNQPVPSQLYHYADNLIPTYSITVNGQAVQTTEDKGYCLINRKWKKGDEVRLHLDMPVRMVKANEKVIEDRDMVAFERGPVVYCAEEADNPQGVFSFVLPKKVEPQFSHRADLLQGVDVVKIPMQQLSQNSDGIIQVNKGAATLIPYYAWCHRGAGQMKVWLPLTLKEVELK